MKLKKKKKLSLRDKNLFVFLKDCCIYFSFASFLIHSGSGHEITLPFGGRNGKYGMIKNGDHQPIPSLFFIALKAERRKDNDTTKTLICYYLGTCGGK